MNLYRQWIYIVSGFISSVDLYHQWIYIVSGFIFKANFIVSGFISTADLYHQLIYIISGFISSADLYHQRINNVSRFTVQYIIGGLFEITNVMHLLIDFITFYLKADCWFISSAHSLIWHIFYRFIASNSINLNEIIIS